MKFKVLHLYGCFYSLANLQISFLNSWVYVRDFVSCCGQVYQAVRLNKRTPTSLDTSMQISYLQVPRPLEVTWFHGFKLQYCNTFTLYFILYNCTTTQYCCQLKMEETSNFSVGGSWCIMRRETFLATTSMKPGRNWCRVVGRSENLEGQVKSLNPLFFSFCFFCFSTTFSQ